MSTRRHGSATFAGSVIEGERKWLALCAWANERVGYGGWLLARAYGDSPDDIALLEHAEEAVAVNAQRRLARTAGRRRWRSVVWG